MKWEGGGTTHLLQRKKGGLFGVTAPRSAGFEVVERLADALYASLLPNMWLANIDWLPTQRWLLLILLAPRVLPSASLTLGSFRSCDLGENRQCLTSEHSSCNILNSSIAIV